MCFCSKTRGELHPFIRMSVGLLLLIIFEKRKLHKVMIYHGCSAPVDSSSVIVQSGFQPYFLFLSEFFLHMCFLCFFM